eukprot:CAMPEP_0170645202 /NCGR_PEP_ID=MMETSP0224-20130122/42936_1 /TAXON_ID=285029 /ORGANISM="Togula jolla, Strain CCCM 725" /LENGTH=41 /DNA_ID= /DNA_START= /DNA_END= /DNA_ORIENTATION=
MAAMARSGAEQEHRPIQDFFDRTEAWLCTTTAGSYGCGLGL